MKVTELKYAILYLRGGKLARVYNYEFQQYISTMIPFVNDIEFSIRLYLSQWNYLISFLESGLNYIVNTNIPITMLTTFSVKTSLAVLNILF